MRFVYKGMRAGFALIKSYIASKWSRSIYVNKIAEERLHWALEDKNVSASTVFFYYPLLGSLSP